MSWKDRLLPGSFRGVPFMTETADAEVGRRVALHEYPLRDKPYAEDLGRKARRFTLELCVLGADYMAGRDALITAFEQPGTGLLVHPYLGEMAVTVIETRGPRESTREGGMARFSVTFVESGEKTFPVVASDAGRVLAERADVAAAVVRDRFADQFDVVGPGYIADQAKGMIRDFSDRVDALRRLLPGVPATAARFLADLQHLTVSVEMLIRAPADLAVGIYELVADMALLPDRVERAFRAYRQLWDLFTGRSSIARTTPSRTSQAINQVAMTELVHRAAVIEAVRTAGVVPYASYDDAIAARDELIGRMDAEAETADDETFRVLEDLRVALVRDMTARGADLARVVRYTPPATVPALVLAHRLYHDPSRAEEIVARNRIRHPGFVVAGIDLEVLTDA